MEVLIEELSNLVTEEAFLFLNPSLIAPTTEKRMRMITIALADTK